MPSEQQLSEVFSEFARMMLTDFPIKAIVDHLTERMVDVVPIAVAGRVTLISAGVDPRYVPASDESALRFQDLKTEIGLVDVAAAAAYLVNPQARADLRDSSDRSRERSLHDALTGLPNRRPFG